MPEESWRPLILDPADAEGTTQLRSLHERGQVWQVYDRIDSQLSDLARTRCPDEDVAGDELEQHVQRILDGRNRDTYGRWIFYPWSGALVHTLPPAEFGELRLDRNRNKITSDEQQRLSDTCVGIAGLSIGNAVALTLAMEGCAHLRLADFDSLDLSNMNRLRAGVHQIGMPKSVLAAHQIYELNPYATISLTLDGITPENIDQFLLGPPRLDVLVDECDSVQMKFLLRERARDYRIPVVMETSDRGVLDVERFDLEPARPVFHGLANALSAAELARAGRNERAAAVLNILGPERISTRLGASMVEVDRTLSTWPQLASDVALGGATVAATVRAIALGDQAPSGRRYVDLQTIVSGTPPPTDPPRLRPGPTRACASAASVGDKAIPEHVWFAVQHAILAPSGGNSQPWQFYWSERTLWVVLDSGRARSLQDGRLRAATLAVGAAVENVAIAAAHAGHRTAVDPFPDPANPTVAAAIHFESDMLAAQSEVARMFPYITQRATNRRQSTRVPLGPEIAASLCQTAAAHGAHVQLVTSEADLKEVGQILGEADRVRFLCAALHAELMAEIRWTPESAAASCDGLDIATLELTSADAAAMRVLARADIAAFLRERHEGRAFAEIAEKAVAGSSAIGLLSVADDTPREWLRGGRALQQVWLAATACRLALHPWTAATYMIAMLDSSASDVFNDPERATLRQLDARLELVFAERRARPRAMLFRLAFALEPTARSRRLPVECALHAGLPPM